MHGSIQIDLNNDNIIQIPVSFVITTTVNAIPVSTSVTIEVFDRIDTVNEIIPNFNALSTTAIVGADVIDTHYVATQLGYQGGITNP